MATATKKRRGQGRGTRGGKAGSRKRAAGSNGKASAARRDLAARAERSPQNVRHEELDVGSIHSSPFQPRQSFPEEEINGLAASLLRDGQLQPVLVRVDGGAPGQAGVYELLDGERRWRAAKAAGLKTIRAEVLEDCTNAQARAIVLVSAIQRKDLNDIERARAIRAMIDAGDAVGPTEAAAMLGLTQGHVSNLLHLLELPEDWQARIISQEMTATHARAALAYRGNERLMKAIGKKWAELARSGETPSVKAWENEVNWIVSRNSKPLKGSEWHQASGESIPIFKPTEAQRAELGITKVRCAFDQAEERATNTNLWNKLQREQTAKVLKRRGKQPAPTGNGRSRLNKSAPSKKLTAAQKKKAEAEAKAEAAAKAERYQRWVARLVIEAKAWVIAEFLRGQRVDKPAPEQMLRVAIAVWCKADVPDFRGLQRICRGHGVSLDWNKLGAALSKFTDEDVPGLAGCVFALGFADEDGTPAFDLDLLPIWELFADFGYTLEGVWYEEQLGPHTKAYWAGPTEWSDEECLERLKGLAAEMGDKDAYNATDLKALVKRMLATKPKPDDVEAGPPLPKELKKLKRPK